MAAEPTLAYAESHWTRSRALPAIDATFIADALAAWPELPRDGWSVLGGGLRSLNLRRGDLVARIASDDGAGIAKEAALLALPGLAPLVPAIVALSRRALLMRYVPHTELPATEAAGERCGAAAAAIHAHEPPPAVAAIVSTYDVMRPWVEERLHGSLGARLGALAAPLLALWDRHARDLLALGEPLALIHCDFKPANVKWRATSRDVLVLDWEFAGAGPALFDLGQLLRWSPPESFIRGVEYGYRSVGGELPDGWRRLAELLDLFNLVGFLSDDAADPRAHADASRRIAQTLAT